MKKLLCFALVLVLLLAVTVSVSAENTETGWEDMDWENIDWDSVDWGARNWDHLYSGSKVMESLRKWLEEEASFPKFFEYGGYASGWRLIDYNESANRRFIADPEAFMIALVKAHPAMQEHFLQGGLLPDSVISDPQATVDAIESIRLKEVEHFKAWELLEELIQVAENKLKVSITNSGTAADWANMDWNSVDWDTFDGDALQLGSKTFQLFEKWLEEEASFSKFFEYGRYTDGWSSTNFADSVHKRFVADPEGFLIALAEEDEDVQNRIIQYTLFTDVVLLNHKATLATIERVSLDRAEYPEAVALMEELIRVGEEKLGISIDNPKTGDPILLTVATLLLSGSGLAVLCRKKKE